MERVGLSLIICTFNRASFLAELLESIERELTERLDLEVIVVDNNCTDDTAAVVRGFEGRLPSLRRLVETDQGLSFARNRGAAESTREYLLYIDDDAILSEGFLDRAEVVLRRFEPDLFGGPVLPRFDRPVPEWFDPDSEIRQFERFSSFSAQGSISGGNFGIRRAVLEELGPFNTALGMKGEVMAFGEDRDMVERYRSRTPDAERRLYYAVELPVLHHTMPYKFDKKYQWKRKYQNSLAQEKTFIRAGKRSLGSSIIYLCAHIVLIPWFACRLALVQGFNERTRYEIVRHACGIAGRALGVVQMIGRRLVKAAGGQAPEAQEPAPRAVKGGAPNP